MGGQAVPELDCDLVMAGGITSGVVFPEAVLELKEKYRFRNIGGTSAGAIAAAVVAAAEFGRRESKAAHDGFAIVKELPNELQQNLSSLFQPVPKLKRLFQFLKLLIRFKQLNIPAEADNDERPTRPKLTAWMAFKEYQKADSPYFSLACAGFFFWALFILPFLYAAWQLETSPFIGLPIWFVVTLAALVLFPLALCVPVIAGIIWDVFKIRSNEYGICPGVSQKGGGQGLIDWIDSAMTRAAGPRGAADGTARPLTFADLTGKDASSSVNLKMMTTNVTFGVGLVLPGLGGGPYYFDPQDMKRILPESVVAYMIERAGDKHVVREGGKTLCRVPTGADMPVILAVRLSLNFPVLFTAVPLYAKIYRHGVKDPVITKVWFSDGGITSNFPIRFFDSLLPSRPTFGISLDDMPHPRQNEVYLPMDAGSGLQYQPRNITSLPSFIGAIFNSAREWQDRKLGRISGYRERIAHIYLSEGEGGLNLEMPADLIKCLGKYGERAGKLMAGTSPVGGSDELDLKNFDFPNHQWRRFLIAYASIEKMLEGMHDSWTGAKGKPSAAAALSVLKSHPPSYANSSPAWRDSVYERMQALMQHFEDTNIRPKDKKFGAPGSLLSVKGSDLPVFSAKLQIVPDD